MPVPTAEQIRGKTETLKKMIAEQGESADAVKRRALRKKLRRTQRKTRRLAAADAKRAAADAKGAAGAEQKGPADAG